MRKKIEEDREMVRELVRKLERRDLRFYEYRDDRKVEMTDVVIARFKQRIAYMDYTLQQEWCR